MMPYCQDEGIAVTTFSPLARGFLTGAERTARTAHDIYLNFYGDEIDVEIARRVRELSQRRGVTPAHIANAWVAGSPRVTSPLIGADAPEQVDVALAACGTDARRARSEAFLEAPYRPRDVINDYNPIRRARALGSNSTADIHDLHRRRFRGQPAATPRISICCWGLRTGPDRAAWATAAASPGPGHIPFQVVLKPNCRSSRRPVRRQSRASRCQSRDDDLGSGAAGRCGGTYACAARRRVAARGRGSLA